MADFLARFRGWFSKRTEPEVGLRLHTGAEPNARLQVHGAEPLQPQTPGPRPSPPVMHAHAKGHNDFSLALYAQLHQQPGSLFFSPFSVRLALAMTYAGSRGETAEQMRTALRLRSSDETLHAGLAEIVQWLTAGGQHQLDAANSLWGQESASLEPAFVELVARHYRGELHSVDFRRRAEDACTAINRWVERRTRQKIPGLIPAGGVDEETRLVLANAIYFKAAWLFQFPTVDTREAPFHLLDGGVVQAPLMHRQGDMRHVRGAGFQAVDLDYRGGELSLLVLLPDRRNGLPDLEARLSPHLLGLCIAGLRTREVELFLPRFTLTWGSADLGASLRALGMPIAFARSQADFSGINGYGPPHEESLFISRVFHKAFVEVNEEGTEAAAATALGMTLGARMPQPVPVFRADHPFVFIIREQRSGMVLFLGRMTDPTRQS